MKKVVFLMCFVCFSFASEEGNWFTKSLDYFSPEKCSPLEKSQLTGGFFTCLNGAGKDTSSGGKEGKGQKGGFGSWGTSSYGSSGKFNIKSFKSNFGQSSSAKESGRETVEWPLSMNKSLTSILACMPKLIDGKCLQPHEKEFYATFKKIFEIQKKISAQEGAEIAKAIKDSKCTQKNAIDVSTQCYSRTVSQFQFFGWKINWKDGKICKLITQIHSCEADAYSSCPPKVVSFLSNLIDKSLRNTTDCMKMNLTSADKGKTSSGYLGYSNYFDSQRDIFGYWGGHDKSLPNQKSEHRAPAIKSLTHRSNQNSEMHKRGSGHRENYFERKTDEMDEDESREDYRSESHHHHKRRDRVHGEQKSFNEEDSFWRRYNKENRDSSREDDDDDDDDDDRDDYYNHDRNEDDDQDDENYNQSQENEEDWWNRNRGKKQEEDRYRRNKNNDDNDDNNSQEDNVDHRRRLPNRENRGRFWNRKGDNQEDEHKRHRQENEEDRYQQNDDENDDNNSQKDNVDHRRPNQGQRRRFWDRKDGNQEDEHKRHNQENEEDKYRRNRNDDNNNQEDKVDDGARNGGQNFWHRQNEEDRYKRRRNENNGERREDDERRREADERRREMEREEQKRVLERRRKEALERLEEEKRKHGKDDKKTNDDKMKQKDRQEKYAECVRLFSEQPFRHQMSTQSNFFRRHYFG